MYGAVNYIREKDCAPEDSKSTPCGQHPNVGSRPGGTEMGLEASHTAEWTGLSGSSELTPRGEAEGRGAWFFFFPVDGEYWHTGDTGERAGSRG